ncbi:MAG TPA: TonB family protein [Methylomirabilota bacterium]|nr:TonB family protein [Methylomirabilota bacterium]
MKWTIRLPKDPAQRTLALAIVTSVLFHLFLVVPFIVIPGFLQPAQFSKRGEPLLVDITPDRPEEKAPLGNPSRPVTPPEVRERPPSPPARPPAPARAVEAPRAPAPRATPPAPPQAVAKAEPTPEPMVKTPEPRPTAPDPQPPQTAPSQPAVSAPPAAPQVAVARPLDSMRRQPGGGGGLTGGGRGGVEGEPIPLDTPEPKYQDYFNKIRERIKANWVYPRQAGERGIEGELLIEFHIAKDGRVAYIELRHSSGTAILDDAALTAVKLAQPFPPVPDEIAKQTLAINGQFKYQIVSGLVNQFLR